MTTATAQPQHRQIVDWEDYLNLPEGLTHYEVIDGEVRPLATPTFKHQLVVRQIVLIATPAIHEKRWGEVLTAPYDVVIRRSPVRTRQPDVMFLSRERFGNFAHLADAPRLEQAPDLVIEVLSPSDTFSNWLEKLWDYHSIGVREVWAVDIAQRRIEVLVHEPSGYRWAGSYMGDRTVQSTVLPELRLEPAQVFAVLDELEPSSE